MEKQQTCGKGLAWNSTLPTKVGEMIGSLSTVLEVHLKALDLTDSRSRQEHAAYSELVRPHSNDAV